MKFALAILVLVAAFALSIGPAQSKADFPGPCQPHLAPPQVAPAYVAPPLAEPSLVHVRVGYPCRPEPVRRAIRAVRVIPAAIEVNRAARRVYVASPGLQLYLNGR